MAAIIPDGALGGVGLKQQPHGICFKLGQPAGIEPHRMGLLRGLSSAGALGREECGGAVAQRPRGVPFCLGRELGLEAALPLMLPVQGSGMKGRRASGMSRLK